MREIKFRVWEGEKVVSLSKAIYLDLVCIQYNSNDCFEIEPVFCNVKIMQFTGLTDKNGVEIYEGDIIKTAALFNNCNQKGAIDYFTVISFMGNYCLAKYGHDTGTPIYPTCLKSSIEVIGNIHENPELLKGAE